MRSLALTAIFWVAGIALTLWIVRCPADQLVLSASLGVLAPFFAVILTRLSGGRIVISGDKSENRPDTIALLILPPFGLVIRALGPMHIIHLQLLLTYTAGIAVVWSCLAYVTGIFGPPWSRAGTFLALLFVGLALGYGAICLTDTTGDKAISKMTEVTVLSKYIGAGKSHTPYLVLSPSALNPQGDHEDVSQEVYEKAVVGQKVCLVEHPGNIGLKWYEVLPCADTLPV